MAGPSLSGQEIKEDHQESQQKQDFRHGSGLLGHTFRFLSSKLHAKKGSGMGSSARSFPQRGNSLRILLRSSLLSVEKPCPLSRPRTSSSTPFALGKGENATILVDMVVQREAGGNSGAFEPM